MSNSEVEQAFDARLQLQAADIGKALYQLAVISGKAYKNSKSKADELTTRNNIE